MADDELLVNIEKDFWPKGVMRSLPPLLRKLGDKHGNLVLAAQPAKGVILVKGAADMIEAAKPELAELIAVHFPGAPVPDELTEGGGRAAAEEEPDVDMDEEEEEETKAPEEPAPKAAPSALASVRALAASVLPGKAPAVAAAAAATPSEEEPKAKAWPFTGRKREHPKAPLASGSLLFECLRKQNSFLRKAGPEPKGKHFSAEPHNLKAWHCKKYSGLVTEEICDVRITKRGVKDHIELVQSKAAASTQRKPPAVKTMGLKKCPALGLKQLDHELACKFYRRSLHSVARLKYVKLHQSLKEKKRVVKKKPRRAPA